MGRGNWFPGNRLEQCRVVYLELVDLEEDDYDAEFAWDNFKYVLRNCLPKSFVVAGEKQFCETTARQAVPHYDRDTVCIAYNGLFAVFVDSQGDLWHQGVGMMVLDDAPSFAASRLDEAADSLFDGLQEVYNVSVRTSAWTSAPRCMSSTSA